MLFYIAVILAAILKIVPKKHFPVVGKIVPLNFLKEYHKYYLIQLKYNFRHKNLTGPTFHDIAHCTMLVDYTPL